MKMDPLPRLEDLSYRPPVPAPTEASRTTTSSPRPRRSPFLKGPIPLDWLQRAAQCPGRALHVGVVLWYLAGLRKTDTVRLTSGVLAPFGVDRFAKGRALRALERAGLVSIRRRQGKNPEITLLAGGQAP